MTRYRSGSLLFTILELSKVKITIAVAFTTITGYVLASGNYKPHFILPTLGIFFLACGSSVINHLQEKKSDARMSRTRSRPLPSRRISATGAAFVAIAETLSGSLILYFSAGWLALLLGLLAMVWYNGVYTPLKHITPHAVVPGSLIGSIPPLVGWVAAGGSLFTFHAAILVVFFFVWQVPHFYLLAVRYGKEYLAAGLPSVREKWNDPAAGRHIFDWIIVTALSAVFMASSGLPDSRISSFLIIAAAVWLVVSFRSIRHVREGSFDVFSYFMKINYFVLAVTLFLVASPVLYSVFSV